MRFNGSQVFLYDWESTIFHAPVAFDQIHYHYQTGRLLKKYKGDRLASFVLDALNGASRAESLKDPEGVFLSYLLHMSVNEDAADPLSSCAVERRHLMTRLLSR